MDERILSHYNRPEGVSDYSGKFERKWNERVNNWNEQRLLQRLLRSASVGKVPGLALDLPCGYGRLYPIVREIAGQIVEGDWSFHMLSTAQMAQGNGKKPGPVISYVRCTALRLPFGNGAFDFVLSVRLSHHIRDHQERIQYAREIMRVSRKWVVFTYFDQTSLKYRLHEFRRRFNGKRPKWTLHPREVEELSRAEGFDLVGSMCISRFFSGHRYALLRRKDPVHPSPNHS